MKVLVIILIFLGEALSIYGELLGAKESSVSQPLPLFLRTFPLVVIGIGLLLIGYIYGMLSFKDIWIVSVASIVSILIIEPVLIYAMFRELPEKGALVGFVFGVLGFIATIFYT